MDLLLILVNYIQSHQNIQRIINSSSNIFILWRLGGGVKMSLVVAVRRELAVLWVVLMIIEFFVACSMLWNQLIRDFVVSGRAFFLNFMENKLCKLSQTRFCWCCRYWRRRAVMSSVVTGYRVDWLVQKRGVRCYCVFNGRKGWVKSWRWWDRELVFHEISSFSQSLR